MQKFENSQWYVFWMNTDGFIILFLYIYGQMSYVSFPLKIVHYDYYYYYIALSSH